MLMDISKLNGINFNDKYVNIDNEHDICEIYYFLDEMSLKKVSEFDDENITIDESDVNFSYEFITFYVHYLYFNYFIDDCQYQIYLDFALKNNHLKYPDYIDAIKYFCGAKQLRIILKKFDLDSKGNKLEMINRIIENISYQQIEKHFSKYLDDLIEERNLIILTKKGNEFIKKYIIHLFKTLTPPSFSSEDFLILCENNLEYSSDEIFFCLLYNEWIKLDYNNLNDFNKDIVSDMAYDFDIIHYKYRIINHCLFDARNYLITKYSPFDYAYDKNDPLDIEKSILILENDIAYDRDNDKNFSFNLLCRLYHKNNQFEKELEVIEKYGKKYLDKSLIEISKNNILKKIK